MPKGRVLGKERYNERDIIEVRERCISAVRSEVEGTELVVGSYAGIGRRVGPI